MRRVARGAILALVLAAAGSVAPAGPARAVAGHVTGIVRTLQRPLAGANVIAVEIARVAVTDTAGVYDLGVIAPGVHTIQVAAVGYEPAHGVVVVKPDTTSDPAEWLLKPLRPDEGGGSSPLFGGPAEAQADSSRADSLLKLPPPPPLSTVVGFYLTRDEEAMRDADRGALGEVLSRLATADSITSLTGGTGAPGPGTWAQWAERLTPYADTTVTGTDLSAMRVLGRRGVAYCRTRAAVATGGTYAGWQLSKVARTALGESRADTAEQTPERAFLDALKDELDRVFAAGTEPPKPPPAPVKRRGKSSRKRG